MHPNPEPPTQHEHTLYSETLFHIGSPVSGFPVTNSLLTSWISVLIIVGLAVWVRMNMRKIPQKLQHIFELIIEQGLLLCDQVTGNRQTSEKAIPIILSIFVFILINNWLGILPVVGSVMYTIDGHSIPVFRGAAADLNTTLAFGVFSVVFANVVGISSIGLWHTVTKFINIPILGELRNVMKNPMVLVSVPINIFVGVLEFLGEFAKIASLSFRLFGNVFAGEVLLASMSAILAWGIPIPFVFLEFFVAIIQAFILSLLTLVYMTLASIAHNDTQH